VILTRRNIQESGIGERALPRGRRSAVNWAAYVWAGDAATGKETPAAGGNVRLAFRGEF